MLFGIWIGAYYFKYVRSGIFEFFWQFCLRRTADCFKHSHSIARCKTRPRWPKGVRIIETKLKQNWNRTTVSHLTQNKNDAKSSRETFHRLLFRFYFNCAVTTAPIAAAAADSENHHASIIAIWRRSVGRLVGRSIENACWQRRPWHHRQATDDRISLCRPRPATHPAGPRCRLPDGKSASLAVGESASRARVIIQLRRCCIGTRGINVSSAPGAARSTDWWRNKWRRRPTAVTTCRIMAVRAAVALAQSAAERDMSDRRGYRRHACATGTAPAAVRQMSPPGCIWYCTVSSSSSSTRPSSQIYLSAADGGRPGGGRPRVAQSSRTAHCWPAGRMSCARCAAFPFGSVRGHDDGDGRCDERREPRRPEDEFASRRGNAVAVNSVPREAPTWSRSHNTHTHTQRPPTGQYIGQSIRGHLGLQIKKLQLQSAGLRGPYTQGAVTSLNWGTKTSRRHVGGMLSVHKDRVEMRISENSYGNVIRRSCTVLRLDSVVPHTTVCEHTHVCYVTLLQRRIPTTWRRYSLQTERRHGYAMYSWQQRLFI